MTITGGSALPKDDIEQMIKDAEAHAAEDAQRRESVELRNQADTLVHQTTKTLSEHGDKVDESLRAEIEQANSDLKAALDGDDDAAVKEKMEQLASTSQQLAQAIYSADNAQSTTPPGDGAVGDDAPMGDDADVVDAEIIDEGDDQESAG